MNRRGNGLSADAYAPLVDLAPHLADALLAALRDAGVAAYATGGAPRADEHAEPRAAEPRTTEPRANEPRTNEPRTNEPRATESRATEPRAECADAPADEQAAEPTGEDGEPLDRLYVDVAMKPTAEGVLRVHLTRLRESGAALPPDQPPADAEADEPDAEPGGGAAVRDEDAIWAEIVAGFDRAVPEGETPWPDEENVREPAPPPPGADRTGRLPRARVIRPADDEDEEFPAADDEGHYVPPPPAPLPNADPVTKGAWIALVGGPLYLLVTVILDWEVPGWAAFLAVAAFIGGFVTLVLRMGDEPRDPDGGAVV
ncbi:hypothetical protein [Actinomadura atramentaria]|uniref:hypothetical protein n=1 Tax=Actinomadura atramentaria TaxID=1990 RepID=UPI0003655FFC|nr:hypothetical protein [Actinomadura atramentaria]